MRTWINRFSGVVLAGVVLGSVVLTGCNQGESKPPPQPPVGKIGPGMRRPGLDNELRNVAPGTGGGPTNAAQPSNAANAASK